MLAEDIRFNETTTKFLREAHLHPQPRIAEGQLLVHLGVKTAIDISDGLISDMTHICEQSHVGAQLKVEDLPLHSLTIEAFQEEALDLALTGGEDYELLFTADTELIKQVEKETGCPVTVIGEVISGDSTTVTLLDRAGKPVSQKQKGWDHFSSAS